MPEPQAAEPSPISGDFASLLAKLTTPQTHPAAPDQPWDDSALADDIANISHDEALRTHSHSVAIQSPGNSNYGPSIHESDPVSSGEEDRKGASISIRLSRNERAELRQRAAEAGLSVSAYLRSCIFEAESLRVQVREALLQFRLANSSPHAQATSPAAVIPERKTKGHWPWPFGRRMN